MQPVACPRCTREYNGALPLCGPCLKELNFARKKLIRQGKYTEQGFFTQFLAPYLDAERAAAIQRTWEKT